ncbi:hypothetical protein PHSY_005343 [Pseudozyma hubeiensis SY62]|uniref:Golgi to ER traffic protein 2 n=1 Tax=Pseudozyma hubeiensis (strain SY62) TaxID=1305764 RepID=R9P8S3_PSEHS|nr:hypothetical protein PHSY_005343 [Pseudozyma hubeiensis SY62]GAC97756.1 hypothetical protein PHSY_005343 [Pseudozyma hubeiensis SY62]
MSDTPTSPDPTPVPAPAVSEQPEASAAAAPVDAAEAARLKREARKARILSKGSDRLARITNTGRGEGASAYLKDNTPSLPTTPTPNSSAQLNNPIAAARDDDDPLEVDISTLSPRAGPPRGEDATNPFAMFGSGGDPMMMGGAGQGGQQNPMEALMAMMGGAGGGMGGPPGADGQPDMSGLPPQLAAMMQQFGAAGGPGGPGGSSAVPTATTTKSLSERCFDLLQAVLVVALAVVAAKSSLFDTNRSSVLPDSVSETLDKLPSSSFPSTLRRWAKLGYQQPSPLEWSSPLTLTTTSSTTPFGLPLFWIFLSLELMLQAARIVIFSRKTPAPPSLLSTLTAMLPIPNLHMAVRLAGKYLALVNALVNDVSLLVFVFGVSVLWSGWKLGGVGMLEDAVKVGGFGHDEL